MKSKKEEDKMEKSNEKSLIFALLTLTVFSVSLWFVASLNKTSAQQAEQQDQQLSPSATFVAVATSLGPIPDGTASTPGSYGSPRDVQFNVTGLSGSVTNVTVSFNASHTWVGDLDVVLKAPGGSPSHVIFSRTGATTAGSIGSSSDLSSSNTYTFTDSATTNWWSAASAAGGGTNVIPSGSYRTTAPGPTTAPPAPVTSMNSAFSSVTNPNGTWTLTFRDGASLDTGTVTGATLDIQTAAVSKPCFDFYGTGRTSFGIVNVEGSFIVWRTRSNGGSGTEDIGYGIASSDFVTPGYYDGDNKADIAVWRSGTYYIRRSTTGNPTDIFPRQFGLNIDVSGLEADYDGDGKDDLTVIRNSGTNFVWYILRSSDNTFIATTFGNSSTDVPIAGADYNGDGKADLTVLRGAPTTYYIGDAVTGNLILTQQWGNFTTDFYVVGDFLGGSKADFAVWRGRDSSVDGYWYIKENGGSGLVITKFGIPGIVGDFPVCGDYNGDGKSDIAVYRPSNKTFYWLTNPSNPSTVQGYTMTFPPNTGAISDEFPIGAFRAY
jgi:subtilisin-like proprotein convertase family protein